jgi:urea carboxylase
VRAPFMSTVWQVSVEPGATVATGEQVLSLEAMKMETPVTAPVDGEVLEVFVKAGEQVAPGRLLLTVGAAQ